MSKKTKIERPSRDPDHYSKRNVAYWFSPEWTRGTSADIIWYAEQIKEYKKVFGDNTNTFISCLRVDDSGNYIESCASYGRIHAIKKNDDVDLYMKSKDGNLSYIQGSIQQEFKLWHNDRSIDYLLLGMDPDDIIAES